MKTVIQVKLTPTAEQAQALRATLDAVNAAACWVSAGAFTHRVFTEQGLRQLSYAALKARGLGAQAAQHVIKKVVDAYTSLHANIRAGNLGPVGSARRVQAEGKPITFRADAAQPFDDRCLSWQHEHRQVSIWTVCGRVKDIAFTGHREQLQVLAAQRQGESDLVCGDGQWYLVATCDITEPETVEPAGWLGVDLGIVNIATTSD
ncbi:MAG: transposase, partial [Longispora sp.]|nr:transposase [Longispora sp. (in: high G+C Gram-positive bacteria)]